MNRQTLKEARYHTIGYIDTAADGKKTGSDARSHIVGYYDPRASLTKDHPSSTPAYPTWPGPAPTWSLSCSGTAYAPALQTSSTP